MGLRYDIGGISERDEQDRFSKWLQTKTGLMPTTGAPGGDRFAGKDIEIDKANLATDTGDTTEATTKAGKGMDAATAKASIDALSGVMNAYMQSRFMAKESEREAEAKAEGVRARGKAIAEMGTAAQTAGGMSDLMALYRNQYARRLT